MKKEQFFRLLGDLDDGILEQYRQMDAQLSQKMLRKKRAMRAIIIAACLALLIGACVPVGMMIADRLGEYPGPGVESGSETVQGPGQELPAQWIGVNGEEELDMMREMVENEDERALEQYIESLEAHGIQSRQDLIDFITLVDHTPYPKLVKGEIVSMYYACQTNHEPASLRVVEVADSGERVYYNRLLSIEDAAAYITQIEQEIAKENRLSAPLSVVDGRLTLYTERRMYVSPDYVIEWWGILDGVVIQIQYAASDISEIDTAVLFGSLEIADCILPTFPRFAMANTKFGSFVERPGYQIYATADSPGGNFGNVDSEWMYEEYFDPNAKQTVVIEHQGAEYELEYQHTKPARYTRQSYHIYESESAEAWLDAKTGAVMHFDPPFNRDEIGEALTEEELKQVAYDFFATLVKDPEAYRIEAKYFESGGASVSFVRYVGELPSCDSASISLGHDGQIYYYYLNYLGAMRNAQPVSDSVIKIVGATLENMVSGYENGTYEIDQYVLTLDGSLALDCNVSITYTDSNGHQWGDGAWMLFKLTEPYTEKESDTVTPEPEPYDPEMDLPRIRYEWDDVEFGDFLETPEYHVYQSNYLAAPEFEGYEIDIDVLSKQYQDSNAPSTATVRIADKEYVLNYTHSRTHGRENVIRPMLQAAHCYELVQDNVRYRAELDQKTGACIAFSTEQGRHSGPPIYTPEQADEVAQNLWETVVPDFENYHMPKRLDHTEVFYYHEVKDLWFVTCEEISIEVNLQNGTVQYRSNFLGAMRNVDEIPDSLVAQAIQTLTEKFPPAPDSPELFSGFNYGIVITEDGRLALDCGIYVPYTDPETQQETQDTLGMLIYLTEPMK